MLKATRTTVFNLITLLFILMALTWWYEGNRSLRYAQQIFVPIENQYEVVAFGDSIVEGLGASYGSDFVSLLEDRLDIEILNLGKRRDTTRSAQNRLASVMAFNPKVAIVLLGGNDVLQNIPVKERLENIRYIVTSLQDSDIKVLLIGTRTGLLSDNHQLEFQQLATELQIVYAPNILDGILYNPRNLFDPIHPNNRGHEIIADRIEPLLRSLVE